MLKGPAGQFSPAKKRTRERPKLATTLATHAYTLREVRNIHDLPLPELMYRAQTVHRQHHEPGEVQLCTLLSVKTGGCPEDCAYCPQSSKHDTGLASERMLKAPEVLAGAGRAQDAGAT